MRAHAMRGLRPVLAISLLSVGALALTLLVTTPAHQSLAAWNGAAPAGAAQITTSPPTASNSSTATFTYSTTGVPPDDYECGLVTGDMGGQVACDASGATIPGLLDGSYTFFVTPTGAGRTYTRAEYSWTIDTVAPSADISSGPAASTPETSATIAFAQTTSGGTAVTFLCSLDGAAGTECVSPASYNGLAPGSHSFTVTARDAAGNIDATPATTTWTIGGATAGDDVLRGGEANDVISGGLGDDHIYGLLGADTLNGGPGKDFLYGGASNDVLNGGPGSDALFGGTGDDLLRGGPTAEKDVLYGGDGADIMHGGGGGDFIQAGKGEDKTSAGPGNDRVSVRDGRGDDYVNCGDGADQVIADAGDRISSSCERRVSRFG